MKKEWCNYCRRYGQSIADCSQKQQDNLDKQQKAKNQKKCLSIHELTKQKYPE